MAVTIKDIAQATGLSTATISKYLNNIPIKEENQKRIEKAIAELHYRPNLSARALRSRQDKTICILMSDLGNYFWGDAITHISAFFSRHGYTVITRSYFFDTGLEDRLIRELVSQHIAGAVLLPQSSSDHRYTRFQEAGIPVVVLDQIPDEADRFPVDCVLSDNYGGGARLAQYLLENGHKDVCIMSEFRNFYSISTRIRGFYETYQHHGIDLSRKPYNQFPPVTYIASSSIHSIAGERFRTVISQDEKPSAIFFSTYEVALGALSGDNSGLIQIPEELSLVTFDDDVLFRALKYSMSCVEQDMVRIGFQTASLLLRRVQGDREDFPKHEIIDVIFHPRRSVRDLNK